jgi:hypothetical protein
MRESTQKPDPVEALRGWRRKRPEKGGERQRTTVFRSATLLGAAIIAAAAAGAVTPVARAKPSVRSYAFPAPPRCRRAACRQLRYELFAGDFVAVRTIDWTMPSGYSAEPAGCATASGAGTETLSVRNRRVPVTFSQARSERGLGFVGHYSQPKDRRRHPVYVVQDSAPVVASSERAGFIQQIGGPCDNNDERVGTGAAASEPNDCGVKTGRWELGFQLEGPSVELYSQGPESSAVDAIHYNGCPLPGFDDRVPFFDSATNIWSHNAEDMLLVGRAQRAAVSFSQVFDCRAKTVRLVGPTTRLEEHGPFAEIDPLNPTTPENPNAPGWAHWHATVTETWSWTLRRVGCGQRG